jgi:hypothetical protein
MYSMQHSSVLPHLLAFVLGANPKNGAAVVTGVDSRGGNDTHNIPGGNYSLKPVPRAVTSHARAAVLAVLNAPVTRTRRKHTGT